jgi:YVTN family beta-propeller protein
MESFPHRGKCKGLAPETSSKKKMKAVSVFSLIAILASAVVVVVNATQGGAVRPLPMPAKPKAVGHPTFLSPHASPIAASAGCVFVVNTPADTVDVLDAITREIVARVPVGIDPVGIAVRPDGREVWVSNHVSDSVSVIDVDVASPTYLSVIATVQDIDSATKATRFDEPVGVAFAGNEKAYVALSSENAIAVVDVGSRRIVKRLKIPAQDPRAIVVRGGRLYVIPFESNNRTQLSGGSKIDGDLVTFNAHEHSIANNNVLSLGHVTDIVKHPKVPDHDLFVFDTSTDDLVATVDGLGTLLYGLAVDSGGRVLVANTDARNDANGRAGTRKHGLAELENRAFLNRITSVRFNGANPAAPEFLELEPLPPEEPAPGTALPTPFAIQVSADDTTVIATAAGSDTLFTMDAAGGKVLGRVQVGAVPRGIALESGSDGRTSRAWVLNAVGNSVSLVDLTDPAMPTVVETVSLEDPTDPIMKRGRIAFNSAAASTTGTFSCASCHPDGHTDQLLWVLQTPVVTGGNQIMPRSTMPLRGLRDTAPFHWDGIPGDPYGGNNSANVHGSSDPNCDAKVPESAVRHLIDAGLATTMRSVGDERMNDEGKAGALGAAERDALATFLLDISFPPAQRRAYTNVVSEEAGKGFRLFHVEGDHDGKPKPNVCGNCHRMPFLVSTNTPGTGMDAPTWRGAYDRFLILPQGRLNIIDFDFYRRVAEAGNDERSIWQFSWAGRKRFDPVWNMVLEASTGFSGAFARQATLNRESAEEKPTLDLLASLESSAREGAVVLEIDGVLLDGETHRALALQFDADHKGGRFVEKSGDRAVFTRTELLALATEGRFVGTFTARHGAHAAPSHPQPALWTRGPIERQRGRQEFPILYPGAARMELSGRHLEENARLIVDGRRVEGVLTVGVDESVDIELASLPPEGLHLLQVQNAEGLFSNDFLFHVVGYAEAAAELRRRIDEDGVNRVEQLAAAVRRGEVKTVRRILERGKEVINARNPEGGSTALSTAALFGRLEVARVLLAEGADVARANEDGNTPLHSAAFLCRDEMVDLLLEKGAPTGQRNDRNESPIDVVSGAWTEELAGFYRFLGGLIGQEPDLERLREERPRMAERLRAHTASKNP